MLLDILDSWASFFVALIIFFVLQYVWNRFTSEAAQVPEQPTAPRRKAAEPRDYKRSELVKFDGLVDPSGPILIGVEGKVFDVSQSPGGIAFYGPGGPYHCFAGKDATLALAKGSTEDEDLVQDTVNWRQPDISKIGDDEREDLEGWKDLFQKYEMVGDLLDG
jgi:membrane-associated progesterone receptor component